MRLLPAGMQSHLDARATTLCYCWRIVRNDGVSLGFTDHDKDLVIDGVTYEAAAGFSATEIPSSVGLSVDTVDAHSVLKSDRLDEDELAAGLFDNAAVDIFIVNWADTSQKLLLRSGNLGEIARGRHAFRAEVRGLAHELNQDKGRLYQYQCDADLGDARCKIDLDQPAFKGTGTVAAVADQRTFTVSGLGAYANDWFTHGLLTWTTGANAGRAMEVRLHSALGTTVTIELWQPMALPVAVSDQFSIKAGCDKQFPTCKAKFNNVVNYRGFPHMPGNDFAISYPNSDDAKKDGGSRQ